MTELLAPLIEKKAKQQQVRKPKSVSQNSVKQKPIDTQKELAKIAGVSHDTLAKGRLIIKHADEETKQKLRTNKVSIHRVAKDIKEKQQKASRQLLCKLAELVAVILSNKTFACRRRFYAAPRPRLGLPLPQQLPDPQFAPSGSGLKLAPLAKAGGDPRCDRVARDLTHGRRQGIRCRLNPSALVTSDSVRRPEPHRRSTRIYSAVHYGNSATDGRIPCRSTVSSMILDS